MSICPSSGGNIWQHAKKLTILELLSGWYACCLGETLTIQQTNWRRKFSSCSFTNLIFIDKKTKQKHTFFSIHVQLFPVTHRIFSTQNLCRILLVWKFCWPIKLLNSEFCYQQNWNLKVWNVEDFNWWFSFVFSFIEWLALASSGCPYIYIYSMKMKTKLNHQQS